MNMAKCHNIKQSHDMPPNAEIANDIWQKPKGCILGSIEACPCISSVLLIILAKCHLAE
jgi:hypothetical protein